MADYLKLFGLRRKDASLKEEQQIRDFVHRVSTDEELRKELASSPNAVVMREGFSPRVAQIIARMVPHLAVECALEPSFAWWHP